MSVQLSLALPCWDKWRPWSYLHLLCLGLSRWRGWCHAFGSCPKQFGGLQLYGGYITLVTHWPRPSHLIPPEQSPSAAQDSDHAWTGSKALFAVGNLFVLLFLAYKWWDHNFPSFAFVFWSALGLGLEIPQWQWGLQDLLVGTVSQESVWEQGRWSESSHDLLGRRERGEIQGVARGQGIGGDQMWATAMYFTCQKKLL